MEYFWGNLSMQKIDHILLKRGKSGELTNNLLRCENLTAEDSEEAQRTQRIVSCKTKIRSSPESKAGKSEKHKVD